MTVTLSFMNAQTGETPRPDTPSLTPHQPTHTKPAHRNRDTLWVTRDVTIRDTDLTFYVGSRPWDQGLGAEAKVLFFLAYSYATLFLERDLDQECAFPGLLLLDNPHQQGIAPDVVRQALTELAGAARDTGTQVISTQTLRPPNSPETIREIAMPKVYATP